MGAFTGTKRNKVTYDPRYEDLPETIGKSATAFL
jgi:hypothetical protein